jgi:Tfp pilus assembly protein PilF
MHTTEYESSPRWRGLVVCVVLCCLTGAVYSRVGQFQFVNYDDDEYVTNNPAVAGGLNLRAIQWAFSAAHSANYHPLTWISLQLDASLFGMRAGFFHFENVLLHAINAMLLFIFLRRAAGSDWPAAFVAFVFAVHPTHVESVAWITERKDVLSSLFLLLAMLAYVRYARGRGRWAYGLMLLWFALSLLAKQMGVTLPAILLLLDYWPLRRGKIGAKKLLVEKIPLVLMSIAASILVYSAQHVGGAVVASVYLPLGVRLQAVPVDYVRYLAENFWPVDLCVFHPYRKDWPSEAISGSVLLLLFITLICIGLRRSRPWLLVGWLWFALMLLPVIGIVQIGSTSTADRYLYLPSVGLSIMLAWSVKRGRAWVWIAGITVIMVLAVTAYIQTQYWRNTKALFSRAVSIINDNANAHIQLAALDLAEHDQLDARLEYELAASIAPGDFAPEFDLGNLLKDSDPPAAVLHYQRAMQLAPSNSTVANNLGVALINANRPADAVNAFHTAINDDPSYVQPHLNLATLLEAGGANAAALREFQAALRIDPTNTQARAGIQRLLH